LREEVARLRDRGTARKGRRKNRVFYLSYRAPPEEAGPEKAFDLSRSTIETRWRAGRLDMQEALNRIDSDAAADDSRPLVVIRRQPE